jgi:hypothetical protein
VRGRSWKHSLNSGTIDLKQAKNLLDEIVVVSTPATRFVENEIGVAANTTQNNFFDPCLWMTMGSMLRLGLAGAAGKEGAMVRSMPREG